MSLFWLVVDGDGFIWVVVGGGGYGWVYFGRGEVVVGIFRVVVVGGGWW